MRVVRTILGMLLLTIGLPALLVGGGFWFAMQHRDAGGAFTGELEPIGTTGYAVVVGDADTLLDQDAPFVRTDDTRLRITADTASGPAFLGLAPTDELKHYLAGVPYTRVDSLDLGTGALPVHISTVPGRSVLLTAPPRQLFWLTTGTGSLEWTPAALRDRRYSLVIMNPTGRPGLQLTSTAEVRLSWLNTATWGLIVLGSLFVMLGMLVLAWPARRRDVVYVVEPSQLPELAQHIGVPLPTSHAARRGRDIRPRTLADVAERPALLPPPASPALPWPPAQPTRTAAPAGAPAGAATATLVAPHPAEITEPDDAGAPTEDARTTESAQATAARARSATLADPAGPVASAGPAASSASAAAAGGEPAAKSGRGVGKPTSATPPKPATTASAPAAALKLTGAGKSAPAGGPAAPAPPIPAPGPVVPKPSSPKSTSVPATPASASSASSTTSAAAVTAGHAGAPAARSSAVSGDPGEPVAASRPDTGDDQQNRSAAPRARQAEPGTSTTREPGAQTTREQGAQSKGEPGTPAAREAGPQTPGTPAARSTGESMTPSQSTRSAALKAAAELLPASVPGSSPVRARRRKTAGGLPADGGQPEAIIKPTRPVRGRTQPRQTPKD